MSDEAYEEKFNEMQKYLPFLSKVIEKLRTNNNLDQDNPRRGQLQKMEMLHGLLTSKEKKLKIDTLLKCEAVLKKLHTKMEKNTSSDTPSTKPNNLTGTEIKLKSNPLPANAGVVDMIGPSSPPASPPPHQPTAQVLPIEIPTERRSPMPPARCSPITVGEIVQKTLEISPKNNTTANSRQHPTLQPNENRDKHKMHTVSKPVHQTTEKSLSSNKSADDNNSNFLNSKLELPHISSKTIPTIITSTVPPSTKFRNPDPPPFHRCNDRYKWLRPNSGHPTNVCKQHAIVNSQEQVDSAVNIKHNDSVYSHERESDHQSKTSLTNKNQGNNSSRPIPVIIDISYDTPNSQEEPREYDEGINQYKKPNINCVPHTASEKKIFSRLGDKLDIEKEPFMNFSINVINDRINVKRCNSSKQLSPPPPIRKISPMKFVSSTKVPHPPLADVLKSPPLTATDISKLLSSEDMTEPPATNNKVSPVLPLPTTKLAQPPLADVLKSPPLTANDINKLLNETICSATETSTVPASADKTGIVTWPNASETSSITVSTGISGIGTRRPPKTAPVVPTTKTPTSSLDLVRKKFAMITKKNSPVISESPASPPPLQDGNTQSTNERLALKFNPHPRVERVETFSPRSTSAYCANSVQRREFPPLSNLTDTYRLCNDVLTSASFLPTPFNVLPTINLSDPRLKKANNTTPTLRNIQPLMNISTASHIRESTPAVPSNHSYRKDSNLPPPRVGGPSDQQDFNCKTVSINLQYSNSPEENWDSEPENTSTRFNENAKDSQLGPNTWRVDAHCISPQKGYSTEENWDSDPERAAVSAKKIQPLLTNVNKNPLSVLSPLEKPVTSTFSKTDPRLNRGSVAGIHPAPTNAYKQPPTTQIFDNRNAKTYTSPPHGVLGLPKLQPQLHPSSTGPRFSAILNDKTERLKYFESKKQKHIEPRTYAEFKEAKARAAAAAKEVATAANITAKVLHPESKESLKSASQDHTKEPTKTDVDKNVKDTKTKEALLAKKTQPRGTNLDKLYRDMSFSGKSELPKTISNFKIPRKHTEAKAKVDGEEELNKSNSVIRGEEKEKTSESALNDVQNKIQPHMQDKIKNNSLNSDSKNQCSPNCGQVKTKAKISEKISDKMLNKLSDVSPDKTSNKSENTKRKKDMRKAKLDIEGKKEGKKKTTKKVDIKKSDHSSVSEILHAEGKISENKISEDKISKDKISKDQISEDQISEDQISEDQISEDQISEDQISEDQISEDQISEGQISEDKISEDQINDSLPSFHTETTDEKDNAQVSDDKNKEKEKLATKSNSNEENSDGCNTDPIDVQEDVDMDNSGTKTYPESPRTNDIHSTDLKMATNDKNTNAADNPESFEYSESRQVVEDMGNTSIASQTDSLDSLFSTSNKDTNLTSSNVSQKLDPILTPKCITRRRRTMIALGSAPEVDKEKINSEKALLFEDIHDIHRQKLQAKAEEIIKIANRKCKFLVDIFQKTDDNCTVSTQNIISGKRRTRTTVNFNEVQQALAVFKHKKAATAVEVKKKIKDSPEKEEAEELKSPQKSKALNTSVTKKGMKKTAKSIVKKKDAEDQSCTVSSTTSQLDELTNCGEKSIGNKNIVPNTTSDNEPTSSAKLGTSMGISDEDQRKQEFLEEMLQDLNNPNSNHDFFFGLLSQILSTEKLQQVKTILESEAKKSIRGCEDTEDPENDAVEEQANMVQIIHKFEDVETPTVKASGKRATRKKRTNELDRLNMDIRDMFISKGVITATGRRMCTLAAAAEAVKPETMTKSSEENKQITSTQIHNDITVRIRKSKVVISPINLNIVRRSTRITNIDEANSVEEDGGNNKSVTVKTESMPLAEPRQRSPVRKMPVLKPNTPIKLLEEEKQLEAIEEKLNSNSSSVCGTGKKRKITPLKIKLQSRPCLKDPDPLQSRPCPNDPDPLQSRPCPKSNKLQVFNEEPQFYGHSTSAEDSEDDLKLVQLRKKLKTSSSKDNTEEVTTEKNAGKEKLIPNTNPHWHAMSKYSQWCLFCDAKFRNIGQHYKEAHEGVENYSSRIAPTILQQFKQGKLSNPIFGIRHKHGRQKATSFLFLWFYRCPFCLQHNSCTTRSWQEHFIKHTGEFLFECSLCRKTANKMTAIDTHIRKFCMGAKLIRKEYQTNPKLIKGHICHMCNFIQLNRANLERHYVEQHGCDPEHVTVLGYSITLFNCNEVEVVSEEEAAVMKAEAVEKYSQESVVNLDDDDEEKLEKVPENRQINIKCVRAKECVSNIDKDEEDRKNDNQKIQKESPRLQANPEILVAESLAKKRKSNKGKRNKIYKKYDDLELAAKKLLLSSLETDDVEDSRSLGNSVSNKDLDSVDKFIFDVQAEVLAAAAKAEAEEKAREEALRSNVFMPTERDNSNSPTIDCLTQSLRTIEQAEKQLQQEQRQSISTSSAAQGSHPLNTIKTTNSSATVSIAERLSQRFKDIQGRNVTEEPQNAVSEKASANSSLSDSGSTFEGKLVIAEDRQDQEKKEIEQEKENENEDDGNWEDIEICETAPSTSPVAAINGKDKQKKKKIYQSLNRLYANINKKGTNQKPKKSLINLISSKRQHSARNLHLDPNKSSTSPSLQTANKMRPLLTNLQDLLPDSPCNDPMDLVPELAPVEPLQDLSDISSILEGNFSAIDTQNLLQQMDINITSDTICINADGQQQSIQDALEFVTEQQEQGDVDVEVNNLNQITPATKKHSGQSQTVVNRVQNLGYSKCTDTGTKFYCISGKCNFLFSNESFGLECHFLNEHPNSRWSGYCCICKCQVVEQQQNADKTSGGELTIAQEMQHMLEKHVQVEERFVEQEDMLLDDEETTLSAVANSGSRPRIKIRRLTGDCLSTTQPGLSTQAECAGMPVPSDLTNFSLSDLLRAEPRPINFKPINTEKQHTVLPTAVTVPSKENSTPLFKSITNEFTITSVTSVGSSLASGCMDIGAPLQISNVRSLSDCIQTSNHNDCSSLPKISNVCSLNTNAPRTSASVSSDALWQQQIEADSVELRNASKESQEMSGFLENVRPRCGSRSPLKDKLGELSTETISDNDSPTLVAETLPVSTATSGDFLITQTISAQYDENVLNGKGAEPQLGFNISIAPKTTAVAELPMAVTSSTREETPVLVRRQFRCMGSGCKYQTCVAIAMSEHLRFHERHNFSVQREFLRCSICTHFSDDVDSYIKHAINQHSMEIGLSSSQNTNKTMSTTSALTQKIQNILMTTGNRRSNNSNNSNDATSTSLSDVPFKKQLEETIKEIVTPTGLPESELYRCVIEGCKTKLTEISFHTHVVYHLTTLGTVNVNSYNYKCPHCGLMYHRPTSIKSHIRSHARHNYFCFQCMSTANSLAQILKHFCEKHWKVSTLQTRPLLIDDTEDVNSNGGKAIPQYFLAHGGKSLSSLDVQQFGEKLVAEWQRKKAASKTHFKPSEVCLLPIQPIFQNEVYCTDCLYKTKVRTNMYRHLQMHKTSGASSSGTQVHMASVDPVNPVPCLNSNERHFDKMCNLASSSLVTANSGAFSTKANFKLPYVYVAEERRFTCGVPDCHYITISDEILRSHLSTLHQNLQQYFCPFCKEDMSTNQRSPTTERILQHLRLHGQKLYQCKECDYLHYMKGVVERHIHERHATLRVELIVHERSVDGAAEGTKTTQTVTGKKFKEIPVAKPAGPTDNQAVNTTSLAGVSSNNAVGTAATTSKHKWECDICKHRTVTHNQMVHHCSTHHACKYQYQCVHCTFGSTQLAHIMTHIDEKHPAKTREARYNFHKIFSSAQEKEADTRPLWQRDDPTRIRHIRGILMEDEEESEQYCKQLRMYDENEDLEEFISVPNKNQSTGYLQKGMPKTALDLFEFACYHCDYKTKNFDNLKNTHWKIVHNSVAEEAKPFYFRLLITFKCVECETFKGNHSDLQIHMQNEHQTRIFVAAEANEAQPRTCGYCDFIYTGTDQLIKHYQRVGHKPQDLKRFTTEQLTAVKKLGGPSEIYVQCMLCTDLFANRPAIVNHARNMHENGANFAFKELKNKIMFRCAICSFTSIEEVTTLRHMIDHYGGFKYCYFCRESQTTFNGYMQHCYAEHRQDIKRFSLIYTFRDISKYLQQIFFIFPNGLIINKKNLVATSYGSDKSIQELYKEICKTSQEPPIPRLSIARLVARKSIEAKQVSSRNGSPNPIEADHNLRFTATTSNSLKLIDLKQNQSQAKRITKRRKTLAFGCRNESPAESFLRNDGDTFTPVRKRKVSENMVSASSESLLTNAKYAEKQNVLEQPYSFYGKPTEPIDLAKVYTKVAIGGLDTPLTIDKFRMLFKIDAQVAVEKLNFDAFNKQKESDFVPEQNELPEVYRHVRKACPASQKFRFV